MASIIAATDPQPTQEQPHTLPAGLWAALDSASQAPITDQGFWAEVQRASTLAAPATSTGLYSTLKQQADPMQYRPRALPVPEEQVVEAGQSFTVLRSPFGSYLRLTATQRELWHAMDGSRTVSQLIMLGFTRFKQVVVVPDLVHSLKIEGFLEDRPVGIYRQLEAALVERSAVGWGQQLLRTLQGRTFAISSIDRPYAALYRFGGWMLFTRLFQLIHATLSAAGLVAFITLLLGLGQEARQVLSVQSSGLQSVTGGLLALWAALLVSFVLHESSHALAVKHYGRKVQRGGLMLYYGMPAAFVDTSDIWLAGRKARIVVSAAGPLSDLLVGGVAALLAYRFPEWAFSGAAYRLAMACYVATLFNLNPLLELDGYFMLVDALRLPDLRRRALAFVSGPLWGKLRQHAPLSHEERIFTGYGILTTIYTVVAVVLAFLFWQRQLNQLLNQLWGESLAGRVLAMLLVALVVVPVMAGLVLATWGAVRAAAVWIQRRGYGRQPALVTALLVLFVGLLAVQFEGQQRGSLLLSSGLWLVALGALGAVLPDYRGADVARALYAFAGAAGLAMIAAVAAFAADLGAPPAIAMGFAGLGLGLTMLAGFAALLDVDLREAPPRELACTAVLLSLAFVVGAAAFARAQQATPGATFVTYLLAAVPAYFGALALALLLPHLLGLRDSRLIWSWGLLWIAVLVQTVAYALELGQTPIPSLDILAAGLWAGAWCVHLITLRQISAEDTPWPHQSSISEAQRLQRAFRLCYAGCYRLLRQVYGSRRAQALDDRMDILAATANWEVTLDHEEARITRGLAEATLDRQGARYAEVLRYTVATLEEIGGASFARRAIQSAYDALPWPEREAAGRRCFPDTPWAAALSSAFGSARVGRIRLLRQVDLFRNCDDDELAALAAALRPRLATAGQQIIGVDEIMAGVWVVEAGEIEVWQGPKKVEELHRSGYFGAEELTSDTPSQSSYRATVNSELLFLPADEYRALLADSAPHAAEGVQTSEVLRLLERVPLFVDIPRNTLRGLAIMAQQREIPARSLIVREGVPSGTFYLIRKGRAAVVARSRSKGEETTLGPAKVVAQLGPEEFFGELELLRGIPPVASVISISTVSLLALPHDAIAALLVGSSSVARNLEQVGTGRMIDLRSLVR